VDWAVQYRHQGEPHPDGVVLSAELAMELSLPSSGFAVVQKQIVLLYKPVTLLLVFLTVSGLQVPESVYSQFPLQNGAIPSARFVSLPRTLQKRIREAEEAIEDSRYNEAVISLGDLLARVSDEADEDDLLSQDFFLDAGESQVVGTPLNQSYKNKVRDMIGGLPAAAMETYELRYGPAASKMLEQAASTRDWGRVREVRRRYFHTQAGYDASWLLAQHEMLQGHPIAASVLLDDIVIVPRAVNRLGKEVLVLHAAACKLAKRKLPAAMSGTSGNVTIDGVEQQGPEDGELGDWIEKFYGSTEKLAKGQLGEYRIFNASENRNGASSGQMPLSNVRWQLDTTVSPKQQRRVSELMRDMASSAQTLPPSWVPLRVGDQLLMRTTEYLVGVDYRTGKRVWLHPWSKAPEEDETKELNPRIPNASSKASQLTEFLKQRVWNDLPYGQVTSDGERVYVLEGLKNVNPSTRRVGFMGAVTSSGNSLVALELESEGILKWFQGVRAGADSPLAEAFFLGPPLPIDGRLYVMCELAGEIYLLCLDPVTGREIWRQQLVANEFGAVSRDSIRRVAGAMLSYQDGVLICPTGAGALVAINLGDRTLRWGVNYQRNAVQTRFMQQTMVSSEQLLKRWFTGTAIVSDLSVLVTPVETDRLYGMNLLTGRALFTKKTRVDLRYLAGIREDNFFLVGPQEMRAYSLSDGSQVWRTKSDVFANGQQVSGQGVFGDDSYLLPTNTQEILQISLKDGAVMGRRGTNYELGNMIAVDGEVITQGPTKLSVAFGEATLAPLVERMLEEDPDNFDALVRKSELLFQSGKVSEGLELLARARLAQPENDEVRVLSVSGMLAKFREEGRMTPQQVEELAKLIDLPTQLAEFNALQLEAAIAAEDDELASRLFLELSGMITREFRSGDTTEDILGQQGRVCLLDAWLNGQLREFLADIEPEANKYFETQLEAYLKATATQADSAQATERMQRVLTHFDGTESAEILRVALDKRHQRSGEAHLLEMNALGHFSPNPAGISRLSSSRLLMLANAYAAGKMPHNVLGVIRELDSRSEELSEEDVKVLEEVRSNAEQAIVEKVWPKNVKSTWTQTARSRYSPPMPNEVSLDIQAGEQFRGFALLEASNNFQWRGPDGTGKPIALFGRSLVRTSSPKRVRAVVSGGVMIVQTTTELLALDLAKLNQPNSESILWSHNIVGAGSDKLILETTATPFGGQVSNFRIESADMDRPEYRVGAVLGDRVIVLRGGQLKAIGLHSGEDLWQTNAAPKNGFVLSDGQRVAVVSSLSKETVFFDIADGRELGRTPFEFGELWRSAGENVLCYQKTDQDNVFDVKVVNPFTGKVLLSQVAHSGTNQVEDSTVPTFTSRFFSGHYFLMMSPAGETFIWDLRDARELVRTQVEPQEKLDKVRVLSLRDRVIVLASHTMPAIGTGKPRTETARGKTHHTVHAAFAFSLADGSLVWSKKFEKPWGCTVSQPFITPAIFLARLDVTYPEGKETTKLETLALDAKTGSVLATPEPVPVSNRDTRFMQTGVRVNTAAAKIAASFSSQYALNLDFTSDSEGTQGADAEDEKPEKQ
jgi:outer membrane protein assembly factor BamB